MHLSEEVQFDASQGRMTTVMMIISALTFRKTATEIIMVVVVMVEALMLGYMILNALKNLQVCVLK